MEGLKHGDQARIAEITGLSHVMVKKVIQGKRKNSRVIAVAMQIIADRERLAKRNKPTV